MSERDAAELKRLLSDRVWRLNNLYWIVDKHGRKRKFKLNWAQQELLDNIWYMNLVLKARQLGFCLDPSTRVLTADLRWVPIGDMKPGQEIVSVDEHVPGGRGAARKMRTGVVEGVVEVFRKAYRITFDDGREVVCTGKHPWLSRKSNTDASWRAIEAPLRSKKRLTVGTKVRWVTKPWDKPTAEDGWFGGMLDGEGSMAKANTSASINVSQRPGPVWDRLVEYVRSRGYNYRIEQDAAERPNKHGKTPVPKLVVGRQDEMLRLIGQTRPTRFIGRHFWEGRELPGKRVNDVGWATITKIEPLGEQRLIDLQTSLGTYIAEGFVSHNTTFICILFLDQSLFNDNVQCGIVAHTREDSEEFFSNKVKFAYDNLPQWLKDARQAPSDSAKKLSFNNGSSIRVGTSLRSGTFQFLLISEFGKVCARYPAKAQEIVTGALNTVQAGQHVFIESTAEGQEGYFYSFCQEAQARQHQGKAPNKMQFKFHFFPWWREQEYTMPPGSVIVTEEDSKYFERLYDRHDIDITPSQAAWYVAKKATQGDDMQREYPSTPEEAFAASVEGAYYVAQMAKLRRDGRLTSVPYDPLYPVNVFWDIGVNDMMSLWFHQMVGFHHRFIDYFEGSGEGLPYYARILKERGYAYGRHYMPHDAGNKSAQTGLTFIEYARQLSIAPVIVVPRAKNQEQVLAGIEQVRALLGKAWFDETKCAKGIKCLDNYRREWDDNLGAFKRTPLHNWASNGADAIRCGAVAWSGAPEAAEVDLYPEHAEDF